MQSYSGTICISCQISSQSQRKYHMPQATTFPTATTLVPQHSISPANGWIILNGQISERQTSACRKAPSILDTLLYSTELSAYFIRYWVCNSQEPIHWRCKNSLAKQNGTKCTLRCSRSQDTRAEWEGSNYWELFGSRGRYKGWPKGDSNAKEIK